VGDTSEIETKASVPGCFSCSKRPCECTDQVKENPKQAAGRAKAVGKAAVPQQILYEASLGIQEGAWKYGRFNYRDTKIFASDYYEATNRHLDAWWEGEDIDPDSGLRHIAKAIASLLVLGDAVITGQIEDDRPPNLVGAGWMNEMKKKAAFISEKIKDKKDPHVEKGRTKPACER
jgi:hypothetical protein